MSDPKPAEMRHLGRMFPFPILQPCVEKKFGKKKDSVGSFVLFPHKIIEIYW